MAISITDDRHIGLNGVIYPIVDRVKVGWLPRFPNKIITGDSDYANEQYLSNWITKDLRGGIGVEEMDEAKHIDCYWFGNLQADFAGHAVLPPLATAVTLTTLPTITNGDVETWASDTDCTGWVKSGTGPVNFSKGTGANAHGGTYGLCVQTTGGAGLTSIASRTLNNWVTAFQGKVVTMKFWAKVGSIPGAGGSAVVGIYDDVGETTTAVTGGWTQYTVTRVLNASATNIIARATVTEGNGGNCYIYIDDITIEATGTITRACAVFNSDTYFAGGKVLYRVDNSTGGIFFEGLFPNTITWLVSSVGSCLYVFLGDSDSYWYRSAASPPVWTQAVGSDGAGGGTSSGATFAVHYAGKAWKITAAGQLAYSAAPNSATPTWTNDALLTDNGLASGDCNNLVVSYDETGTTVIYADTKQGRFEHSVATSKFLATGLRLANHPNGGKGSVRWNDGDYVSAGLAIKKYQAGSTVVISDEGLNKDDGLPTEYAGEVIALIDGLTHLYALMDASQTTGTGYSAIYRRGIDTGWHCWWDGSLLSVTDGTIHFGIVSATYSYRFWFDHNGTVYYIPLSRENQNPKKVTGSTYSASGFLVSPWFDAGTKAFTKACKRITAFCEDMTENETVIIKYRLDHTTTALASTWVTLTPTIAADGITTYNLASGAGVAFKSIQYRIDLARGSTNTLSPDVQGLALSYRKNLGAKHAWTFTIDLKNAGANIRTMITNLETAVALNTWMEFVSRDSTKETSVYVEVESVTGKTGVGPDYDSQYAISVIEV